MDTLFRIHVFPRAVAFGKLQSSIDREAFESLPQSTGPANLDGTHLYDTGETEMLFERQATEVAAARNLAELLPPGRFDRHSRADGGPVALDSGQPHVEVVARQALRTVDAGGE